MRIETEIELDYSDVLINPRRSTSVEYYLREHNDRKIRNNNYYFEKKSLI